MRARLTFKKDGKPPLKTFVEQNRLTQKRRRAAQKILMLTRQKRLHLARKKMRANDARRARTRTLIQLGGLLEKAGIPSMFDLELGNDLQQDLRFAPNVATLMGALLHLKEDLDIGDFNHTLLQIRGKEALAIYNKIIKDQ